MRSFAFLLLELPLLCEALRNLDRCEALIFTNGVLMSSVSSPTCLRQGVDSLVAEASQEDTLVAAVGPALPLDKDLVPCVRFSEESVPSFTAFNRARASLSLVPDGFGGSDGFGSQPKGTQREPRAAWTVAFVTTFAECDAALRAGMRTIALPAEEGGYVADDLEGVADACLDDLAELNGIDDLSTP